MSDHVRMCLPCDTDSCRFVVAARRYIAYVKTTFNPTLHPTAQSIISSYYQIQRQKDSRNAGLTTIRMLESLIRISQAHARLMFRNEVIAQDAVVAVFIVECSLSGTACSQFSDFAYR